MVGMEKRQGWGIQSTAYEQIVSTLKPPSPSHYFLLVCHSAVVALYSTTLMSPVSSGAPSLSVSEYSLEPTNRVHTFVTGQSSFLSTVELTNLELEVSSLSFS